MSVLRVWGRRSAFNVQKVLWLVGELGLPHEHVEAGGAAGGLDAPAFRRLNPHGRVPVIEDGETVVWESHAILRYLAATHAPGTLWPDAAAARSEADRWMDWAHTSLQPAFMQLFWGFFRTPEGQRDAGLIERARRDCAERFRRLDAHLAGRPFVAGPAFGLGDIPAGTALYRWFEMGVPVPELPHLRRWYEALGTRPAYREHVMRPFEELAGRLDF